MSQNMIVASDDAYNVMPKKMHERLGSKFKDHVASFAAKFPIQQKGEPSFYPVKELDLWLADKGFLVLPEMEPAPTNGVEDPWRPLGGAKSDGWIAHTQRRYRCVQDLNKATAHSRLREQGINLEPFSVTVSHSKVCVRHSELKVSLGDLPREIESIMQTKRTKLERLLNSSDFSVLPPSERNAVESLMLAIETFEGTLRAQSMNLTGHFRILRKSLQRAVLAGVIVPQNGAIKAIIAADEGGN